MKNAEIHLALYQALQADSSVIGNDTSSVTWLAGDARCHLPLKGKALSGWLNGLRPTQNRCASHAQTSAARPYKQIPNRGVSLNRIIALGFFDGVHLGHRTLLDRTRQLADETGANACAITFDRSPGKGGVLYTTEDRVRLLKDIGRMDEVLVLPFDEQLMHTPWEVFASELFSDYGAKALVCGWDYRFGARAAGTAEMLKDFCKVRGVRCDILPALQLDGKTVSSTLLKTLVTEGDMEQAMRFYGHPHSLSGTVVSGRGLGHKLGFPTANLIPKQGLLLPKPGVYAVTGTVEGHCCTGVCNVGTKPTVNGDSLSVETWLSDFDGDLYGKQLTVEFYKYLRPERKFDSLEALKEEIYRNQAQARAYFATH